MTMKTEIEEVFPKLASLGYEVTSEDDPRYNCFAWAAGDNSRWWAISSPRSFGGYYWPESVADDAALQTYIDVYRIHGFTECEDAALEADFEKIALYMNPEGNVTHATRQLQTGRWTSKLGRDVDIEHGTADALASTHYGSVVKFMKRPIREDRLHLNNHFATLSYGADPTLENGKTDKD